MITARKLQSSSKCTTVMYFVRLCVQVFWLQFLPTPTATGTRTVRRVSPWKLHTILLLRLVSDMKTTRLRSQCGCGDEVLANILFWLFAGYQMAVHSQGDWQSGVMMYMQGDPQASISTHQQGEDPQLAHLIHHVIPG